MRIALRHSGRAKGAIRNPGANAQLCRTLIVTDPDGNELYFPDPDDPGGDRTS